MYSKGSASNKLLSVLIAAVFSITTFSAAAQTPAPADAPKAEATMAKKTSKKTRKSAAPAATPR
jgi:hypothetical protein